MPRRAEDAVEIVLLVTPRFNMAATMAFLDPFRAANYLAGRPLYGWTLASAVGGMLEASNGLQLKTEALAGLPGRPDMAVVSSSWTPEAYSGAPIVQALRRWARFGTVLGGLDTGAFLLAAAGLLDGRRATVHYEHMDAFAELFPRVDLSGDIYVIDGDRFTCSGGVASGDLALQIVSSNGGRQLSNSVARYVFHDRLRPPGTGQNPGAPEPLGERAPERLRAAVRVMEDHLEEPMAISEIATQAALSQRQMERLFARHTGRSPARYYSGIRLDRARGLVTQTEMPVWEIALACGFQSPEHFSRAYRARFGLPPRADRVEGRVPFEFRAWPLPAGGGDTP